MTALFFPVQKIFVSPSSHRSTEKQSERASRLTSDELCFSSIRKRHREIYSTRCEEKERVLFVVYGVIRERKKERPKIHSLFVVR